MAPLPTQVNNDPNVGGGKAEAAAPLVPEPVGEDGDVGGGVAPLEATLPGPSAQGSENAPVVDLPQVRAGEAVEHGAMTFMIGQVQNTPEQFYIEYTISGLGTNYQPPAAHVDPAILLPDGRLLPPISGEGSGSPGSETVQAVFPALPPGTQSFQLVLENQWSGSPETWRVPVNIDR